MIRRLILALTLLWAPCLVAQNLLPQGGLGVSCNAITASTSANPGASGGCTALALVTSGGALPGNYTWQVITTGSPASLTVNFDGSLDGVTWTQIDTTSVTTGATKTVANANSYRFLGCIPATLTGGSSPTVTCQISVTSTAVSGGSGTVTNTSGSLTANAVVLGAGTNDTKVSTGITTNGASELDLGVNGTASGTFGLNGSTSAKYTCTTNAGASLMTCSNGMVLSAGSMTLQGAGTAVGAPRAQFSTDYDFNNRIWASATAPTIAGAGCGGSAASISSNNGTIAFIVNTGTAPTSGGCTITLPAANTDWVCSCRDATTKSTTVSSCEQSNSAASTTSAVLQIFSDVAVASAPVANDLLRVSCFAD